MTGEPVQSLTGSDFPTAAGFFIHNYAAALSLASEPRSQWKEALLRFADSWWERRLDSGLCPKSGRSIDKKDAGGALGMTMGLAICLMDAATLVSGKDPELSERLASRAARFAEAVLAVPQYGAGEGRLALRLDGSGGPDQWTQAWSGNRGNSVTARTALSMLRLGDHLASPGAMELVEPAAAVYLKSFIPREQIVRARDPGNVIALMTEFYRRTGERKWLDAAMRHATDALELFFDCPLPRMSLGRRHYESQQGSSELVHSLARLAFVAEGSKLAGGLTDPVY
jgi:hypothetical protein